MIRERERGEKIKIYKYADDKQRKIHFAAIMQLI